MGSLGHSCLSLVVDSKDVLDLLLEVEGVSESSSHDCELEHVEDVGLLVLLVLGVVLGETDCVGVLGVEGTCIDIIVYICGLCVFFLFDYTCSTVVFKTQLTW